MSEETKVLSRKRKLALQQIMLGGDPFTVHAKVITTELNTVMASKHAIGATSDHLQNLGTKSRKITVEGFTTVPYYQSGLWIIEVLQKFGKPVPFISSAVSTMVYILNFSYQANAERFESLTFKVDMVEAKPLAGLIGDIVSRSIRGTFKFTGKDNIIQLGGPIANYISGGG